ncbi:MAG: glycoside hydrolase family 43 protein [Candidatus Lokiarchaeota archaeon]|nr:glycoside hydrolase family 43 protein [Candidatus Lokiarchaeota archaeon]
MYCFSFFREMAPALHLAISSDLLSWIEVTDEEPVLESNVGALYWRDPFIMRAEDGTFHLLCTDGWTSPNIVHASSRDLISWSEQDLLPVMHDFPGAKNAWAPEACYDREAGEYVIFWSSTVPDAFPEHPNKPTDYQNHRIYACRTKDFKAYTKTALFFDPGFNCIDASIDHDGSRYLMAFKDERGNNAYFPDEPARKHVLAAWSESLSSAWSVVDDPVSISSYGSGVSNDLRMWAEGPSVFWDARGKEWWIFYEYFRSQRYGAARSKDGLRWDNVDDKLSFPPGTKHGTVF